MGKKQENYVLERSKESEKLRTFRLIRSKCFASHQSLAELPRKAAWKKYEVSCPAVSSPPQALGPLAPTVAHSTVSTVLASEDT